MTTGERIKALRLSLGMTQTELGNKIGVQTAAIHKYENGIVVNLKRDVIAKLADALETTPSYLLGYDDEEDTGPTQYFLDDEAAAVAQELHDNPDLRILFDAARSIPADDMRKVAAMIEAYKKAAYGGDD